MPISFIDFFKNPFFFGLTSAILALIISPLQFLKIQRQASLASYTSIFVSKYKTHGIGVFFVGAIPYAFLQFFSSAAFGISEFFSKNLILKFNLEFNVLSILIATVFAGFFETALTFFFEMKTIEKNKMNLLEIRGSINSIIIPLLLRNSLYWIGSLGSIFILNFIERKYNLNISYNTTFIISFLFGLFWAVLTIPIDVVITQNYGSSEKLGIIDRLKKNIFYGGFSEIFNGSLMRIISSTLFTICIVLTEYFLKNN